VNFETKYLIRWGIPGWVLLLSLGIVAALVNDLKLITLITEDPIKLISLIVSMAGIGVPVGYLIHQIYFSFFWVRSKKKGVEAIISKIEGYVRKYQDNESEYNYLEYLWQSELSLLAQDKRDYIAERYRHLLSTTHSLGVLFVSLLFSLLFSFVVVKDIILFVLVSVLVLGFLFLNYFYYSKATNDFKGLFLNEFINDPERNKNRKEQ
jgi:hypothetical protein